VCATLISARSRPSCPGTIAANRIKQLIALAAPELLEIEPRPHSLCLAKIIDDGLHGLLDVTVV
jgi:hypothetical protein